MRLFGRSALGFTGPARLPLLQLYRLIFLVVNPNTESTAEQAMGASLDSLVRKWRSAIERKKEVAHNGLTCFVSDRAMTALLYLFDISRPTGGALF
jgi:hypothetical protein